MYYCTKPRYAAAGKFQYVFCNKQQDKSPKNNNFTRYKKKRGENLEKQEIATKP